MRRRTDTGVDEVINIKRAVLILPLYVVALTAVDMVFHSTRVNPSKSVLVWIVVGFIASAIAVVAAGIWYFTQRASGKISQKREHAYIALLVGVMASLFAGDVLGSIASLLLGGRSVWAMAPSYALSYVVLLWAIAWTSKALDSRAGNADDRSGTPR